MNRKIIYPPEFFDREETTMTDPNSYVNLQQLLPADTITETAFAAGLGIGMTNGGLVGQIIVQTDIGWTRFLLAREAWISLLDQAADMVDLHNDTTKFKTMLTELQAAEEQAIEDEQ